MRQVKSALRSLRWPWRSAEGMLDYDRGQTYDWGDDDWFYLVTILVSPVCKPEHKLAAGRVLRKRYGCSRERIHELSELTEGRALFAAAFGRP